MDVNIFKVQTDKGVNHFKPKHPARSSDPPRTMTSLLPVQRCSWAQSIPEYLLTGKCNKVPCLGKPGVYFGPEKAAPHLGRCVSSHHASCLRRDWRLCAGAVDDSMGSGGSDDEPKDGDSGDKDNDRIGDESLREKLERIVGADDSTFSGLDLATLIRNKYGRSYDIQLIKKEFMGRNLLALNVMWKYLEQRSFPLTEEEYILRLDDVANTLKCWGAVSHIRNSLATSKERPRIGKAVSIFIDMDESGGRANEWIYK
ncbi:hypothetical protein MLD38_018446 [Melastoma candidum]|uniref:Uncharacterized protein n=1 Tax=Melastoma candidum TaxID=119954 RepID=A0ACB9QVS6_9MYRT|nr:hypothetical protein MLD38_018446 [Melastoma candidum]